MSLDGMKMTHSLKRFIMDSRKVFKEYTMYTVIVIHSKAHLIEIQALIRCFSHCVPIILSYECELPGPSFHTVFICSARMKLEI